MIDDYVGRIEEACGASKTKDYIVILKHGRKEDALKKILEKSKILSEIRGVAMKASFMGKEFTVFMNGRLMFKSLKDREELDLVLKALLE